jgi:hypothetical protein
MSNARIVFIPILLTIAGALGQNNRPPRAAEYPSLLVREEQDVIVNRVKEIWQLRWIATPAPYCEPSDVSLTCPCTGFAYGEAGDLFLTRIRNGIQIDRLHLTPFFTEEPQAVVQRWPANDRTDFKLSEREDFPKLVSKRPIVQAMHFADYDHDGKATEFYLQTEAQPCGKSTGVVIGLSTSNSRLHIFSSESTPGKPLYLQRREWEALRQARSGSAKIVDWLCGDHGAETQTELELRWSANGIDGVRREYTCPSGHEPRRLISTNPL